MARWADQTCGGVACAQRLAGNVGYLDLQPVLFPAVLCAEVMTAAVSLLATTDALIIDLRNCLGGEPSMVTFLISYLWDRDPAQLSGMQERQDNLLRQTWTLPYVPGRRFGKDKPVYVLTSAVTFSGGEQPDIQTTAGRARDTAYERALQDVIGADGTAAAEARDALAGVRPAG
jgi:Peptidase family S41